MKTNIIYQGDALTKLKEFPDKSINMVMTSPPYWALRDYSVEGQLGLEQTFEEYIKKLCNIFDEVKRVLRDDGTCWVNLGDTYYGGGNNRGNNSPISYKQSTNKGAIGQVQQDWSKMDYKSKCLIMIPQRFAIEMVNRDWILRNVIIWHKPNCMPSSAKDRFTVDFEYIFFFSKKKKYYFETQYEKTQAKVIEPRMMEEKREVYSAKNKDGQGVKRTMGRNRRTVWSICPKPFSEAHFAVYPEELCETPIKSGCPEFVCVKCGIPIPKYLNNPNVIGVDTKTNGKHNMQTMWKENPQVRRPQKDKAILQQKMQSDLVSTTSQKYNIQNKDIKRIYSDISTKESNVSEIRLCSGTQINNVKGVGKVIGERRGSSPQEWDKGRQHDKEFDFNENSTTQSHNEKGKNCNTNNVPSLSKENKSIFSCPNCGSNKMTSGVVLDCFFGAGTTGLVALKQNKKFIGIELNKDYIEIAKKRLKPFLEQTKLT